MQSGETGAQPIFAILAFVTLASSGTAAAQPGGDIGPESRASLQIRVSVAERVGVRLSLADGVPPAGRCIFSTARGRTFAATLEPMGRSADRPPLPSFEIAAASPGEACGGDDALRTALGTLSEEESPGSHWLILAPQ